MHMESFDKAMISIVVAVVSLGGGGLLLFYDMHNSHVQNLAIIEATKTMNKEELNKRLEALEKLVAKHDKDLNELNAVFNAGD